MLFRRPGAEVHPIPWFPCHFMKIHPKRENYVKIWFIVKLRDFMVKYVKPLLSPVPGGPCKTLDNTCKFHALLRPRAAGNAQKWKIWWNGGIPRNSTHFGDFHQKAPETAFLVKIHPETHFSVPGSPKKHRKSIGFVGVSTPGPPGHHFHPTELKMVWNHPISMKCGEIPPISTKIGYFGRIPPQGGNTAPRTLLNTLLLQPPVKSCRACDSNFFYFFTWKYENSWFARKFQEYTHFTWNSPKSDFGTSKYLRNL